MVVNDPSCSSRAQARITKFSTGPFYFV
eukprot:SAG11_NODE_15744_length_567_cov_1.660256_1_plen_27_part_10